MFLNVSRLGLQLSLSNPLKPGVKSRMKNVVGVAATGDAPTTSARSTFLVPTNMWLILKVWRVPRRDFWLILYHFDISSTWLCRVFFVRGWIHHTLIPPDSGSTKRNKPYFCSMPKAINPSKGEPVSRQHRRFAHQFTTIYLRYRYIMCIVFR